MRIDRKVVIGVAVAATLLVALLFLRPSRSSLSAYERSLASQTADERLADVSGIPEAEALAELRAVAARMKDAVPAGCTLMTVGAGWGHHVLCAEAMPAAPSEGGEARSCGWLSYGISDDWSFDTDMRRRTGCVGLLFDPTTPDYKSAIGPGLYFTAAAAPMLGGVPASWLVVHPPVAAKMLPGGGAHIPVVKMDCEGCEYALARSIGRHNPKFFEAVDQFAIEVHTGLLWARDHEHVVELGRLFVLLRRAGLQFIKVDISNCYPQDEKHGPSELSQYGITSAPKQQCHEYLFARIK